MSTTAATPLTLTARCPDDVLALVPVVLGFVPADSVAMLTFGARDAFHARVDLPGPDEGDVVGEVVAALLSPARRHGVRRAVVVVYTDDAGLAAAVAGRVRTAFAAARIDVPELLRADGSRWWRLAGGRHGLTEPDKEPDKEPDEEPEEGVPYDVTAHPFVVQAVLRGRVTLGSRQQLADTLAVDAERAARVAALVDALGPPPTDQPRSEILAAGEWAQALVRRHTADASAPSDADCARLLHGLQALPVRDAAWWTLTRAHADRHVAFWTDVCRRTPAPLLAPPATLLGWAAWQAGHGALAWCAADLAGRCDSGYTLLGHLRRALEHAVPPSVWEPGDDWREAIAGGR